MIPKRVKIDAVTDYMQIFDDFLMSTLTEPLFLSPTWEEYCLCPSDCEYTIK